MTRWQACKQSLLMQSANITSPVFPSGCYFISINLAAIQSCTKEGLTSGFCHLSHINKTPEATEPFRPIINLLLYAVRMDAFMKRFLPSPWKRSTTFAFKDRAGPQKQKLWRGGVLLLDFPPDEQLSRVVSMWRKRAPEHRWCSLCNSLQMSSSCLIS